MALVRVWSGHTLSPAVAEVLVADPDRVLSSLHEVGSLWDAVVQAEPTPTEPPSSDDVDRALAALADLADLKSPYHLGHSRGVADLASSAGRRYGLSEGEVILLKRAGLVHDIGRIAVSSGLWGCSRPLRPDEWERVRMHPYHTHQVLDRCPFLRSLADVATAHHERLDGSGYYRGLPGSALPVSSRVLAAADTYHTKTEPRPHRATLTAQEAGTHLRAEVKAGRQDAAAVEAVLAAAGQPATPEAPVPRLTSRELEILGQVARGGSMREIARALSISPKTVVGTSSGSTPRSGSRPGRARRSTPWSRVLLTAQR